MTATYSQSGKILFVQYLKPFCKLEIVSKFFLKNQKTNQKIPIKELIKEFDEICNPKKQF